MPHRPNILLIVADDHCHAAMSCATGPTQDPVRTPHLDALADRGVRFTHAYHAGSSVGAVCMPSRAMLHGGTGPFNLPADMAHGVSAPYLGPPTVPTLGQRLRDAGYTAHHIGKWHNFEPAFERSFDTGEAVFHGGMPEDHFNTPMSRWDGKTHARQAMMNCHGTDVFAEAARAFLHRRADDDTAQPFFLSLAFTAPHDPRRTHPEYHARFPAERIDLPPSFTPNPEMRPDRLPIRDNLCIPLPRDPAAMRHEIAGYYAMVEHLDHGIGRVLDALSQTGLADDTLVVYTADHGHAVGQHGLLAKQTVYDHSTRVPLIVAGPGVARGAVRDQLVYQHDTHPTLLTAAGLDAEGCAFDALTPLLTEAPADWPRQTIGSFYGDDLRMITDGRTKLVVEHHPQGTTRTAYDLAADPWEMSPQDASAGHPLDDALYAWQREHGDPLAAHA
ncbi:MAG: sulfatase-like hydrolase/transferase [Planctomycetota bacterium]